MATKILKGKVDVGLIMGNVELLVLWKRYVQGKWESEEVQPGPPRPQRLEKGTLEEVTLS